MINFNSSKRLLIATLFLLLVSFKSIAVLKIEITSGIDGAIPIAIKPFTQPEGIKLPVQLDQLISNNLQRSGLFIPSNKETLSLLSTNTIDFEGIKSLGLDYFVLGKIELTSNKKYKVSFQLFDSIKKMQLIGIQYTIPADKFRALGHKLSDLIYEKIIGKKGAFSTQILYVSSKITKDKKRQYLLNISDSDGFNPRVVLTSSEPIMSPSWSPDAKNIAYVSFENRKANVFVQHIKTGIRTKITSLDGINGAPSFSPDGKKLALTLSYQGNAEIYVIDLATKKKTRVTKNSGIDTEPVWLPDGKSLIFTSNRSGSAQIYRKSIDGGRAQRLTFEGVYNASPAVSSDGHYVAMVHLYNKNYQIAILDISNQSLRIVSTGKLDESPSFAPNDSMILYGSEKNNRGVFGAVSFDGRMKQIFSVNDEGIREPVWSPFID